MVRLKHQRPACNFQIYLARFLQRYLSADIFCEVKFAGY